MSDDDTNPAAQDAATPPPLSESGRLHCSAAADKLVEMASLLDEGRVAYLASAAALRAGDVVESGRQAARSEFLGGRISKLGGQVMRQLAVVRDADQELFAASDREKTYTEVKLFVADLPLAAVEGHLKDHRAQCNHKNCGAERALRERVAALQVN